MDPITGRFTGQSKVYALSGFIRGMVRDKVGVAFIWGLGFINYFLRVNIAVQLFEFILYFFDEF